jgi:hypothetical protein
VNGLLPLAFLQGTLGKTAKRAQTNGAIPGAKQTQKTMIFDPL